ncbi:hypothetical protein BCR35DRAFT_269588, partial [Leucosporidium creatinivorum]
MFNLLAPPRAPCCLNPSGGYVGSLSQLPPRANRSADIPLLALPLRPSVLPLQPDEEALICADADCTIRFGLIDRKHHCRRCGEIYCAAHSSRTSSLW